MAVPETVPSTLLPRRLRRAGRRLWRTLKNPTATVIYHPRYNANVPSLPTDPLRAERILAFLAAEGLVLRCLLRTPRPASLKSLATVHTAEYLDAVHTPETLSRIVGDEIGPHQVDRLLDFQRLQVGGTKLALLLAISGRNPVINLGGGLHHAHADQGQGFCIWNDVAVAIREARGRGWSGRVLVIDLDLHDGDGTRAIFAEDESVHTFSIHARHWGPTEAVESTAIELGDDVDDEIYLDAIRTHLPPVVARFEPQLIVYLAGADPAHDDRLGDWDISAAGMLARDRFVSAVTRRRGRALPTVIVLAGGYGNEAWRYSARSLSALLHGGRAIEPPSSEEMTLRRYQWIASLLDPAELSGGSSDNSFGLSEDDLYLPAWSAAKESRFLGYYTKHGIELVLERAGLLDRLRDLGYSHPDLELKLDDSDGHTMRIYDGPKHEQVLVELRLRKDRRTLPPFELLGLDWLLLQNPRATFPPARPALPGQDHPGLGMADDAIALLLAMCARLHLDGIVWAPAYLHTSAPWRDRLVAVDPAFGIRLRAFERAFAATPLHVATRAIVAGEVVDEATGEVVKWRPAPMVIPFSDAAKAWAEDQRKKIAALAVPKYRWRRAASK